MGLTFSVSPHFMSMLSRSVVSDSLWLHGLHHTRLLCPWESPGKYTGVGWHSLLQRIFPTQGSNLGFLHCRQILYHLSHQGTPLNVFQRNEIFQVEKTWRGLCGQNKKGTNNIKRSQRRQTRPQISFKGVGGKYDWDWIAFHIVLDHVVRGERYDDADWKPVNYLWGYFTCPFERRVAWTGLTMQGMKLITFRVSLVAQSVKNSFAM